VILNIFMIMEMAMARTLNHCWICPANRNSSATSSANRIEAYLHFSGVPPWSLKKGASLLTRHDGDSRVICRQWSA
jgi:hypothetical protein